MQLQHFVFNIESMALHRVALRRVASTGYSPRATLHRSCRSRGTRRVEKESERDERDQEWDSPLQAIFAPAEHVYKS